MQHLMLLLASVLLGINPFPSETNDQILGKWANEDQTGVLEFVKNGSSYDAIILEAKNPAYIGEKQITSLSYHKKNQYKGGTLYAFEKGQTLNCAAKLISDTQLELRMSKGPFTQKRTLTRLEEPNQPE